jgi:hypothetical protein
MGPNAAQYLADIVAQVNESSRWATIGGVLAMVLGATAAFSALQDSLNRIWHQPDPADLGFRAALKGFARGFFTRQILAFLIMLLLGALLLASLFASAAIAFVAANLPGNLPAPTFLLQAADFLTSVALTMLLFGSIYQMLHRKSFGKKGIWTGAAVTAFLFAGKDRHRPTRRRGARFTEPPDRSSCCCCGSTTRRNFSARAEFTDVYWRRVPVCLARKDYMQPVCYLLKVSNAFRRTPNIRMSSLIREDPTKWMKVRYFASESVSEGQTIRWQIRFGRHSTPPLSTLQAV